MSSEHRTIDPTRLASVQEEELAAFVARTPRSAELLRRAGRSMVKGVPMGWMWGLYRHPTIFAERGAGSFFWDVDGNRYLDFNLVDLAMTMGFGSEPITRAVTQAMRQGAHFLLPIEAAIGVTESLAERTGVPFWQFTLSASGANTEVIRIARAFTGRQKILVFGGHYHGHVDELLVDEHAGGIAPAMQGLAQGIERNTLFAPFNDANEVRRQLASNDVALVMTEPALSNCTLVLPDPGFLDALRKACQEAGTLLCLDEAHTFQFAYGGLTREWNLQCDFLVLGKGLGTGVSFGLYGMSAPVREFVESHADRDLGPPGIAVGGTTYASAVAILAAKAALEEVLTRDNYRRVEALGGRLAAGLQRIFDDLGLSWRALALGPRAGYCLLPRAPRDGREALLSLDLGLISGRKLWMANRGVWDAMATAGPQVSFSHTVAEIDTYLGLARSFLEAVVV